VRTWARVEKHFNSRLCTCMESVLFAHAADAHAGAQERVFLKEGEREAFSELVDTCIRDHVDFLIFSGDLFDSNVPPMAAASAVAGELKRLKEAGIPVYEVHGSHDNSPTHSSMIEVLEGAGLLVNAYRPVQKGESVGLQPVEGPKGVKIFGLPGLKEGREREYFELLDREGLSGEPGKKIFAFHSAIEEFRSGRFAKMEAVPLSYFPKGFDYYAGGHVHQYLVKKLEGYGTLAYPGPLFAGWGVDDLVDYSREGGGFLMVNLGNDVTVDRVKVYPVDVAVVEKSADGLSATDYVKELEPAGDYSGKVVLIKLGGKLSSGRVADVSSAYLRSEYAKAGALDVMISRGSLSGPEQTVVRVGSAAQLEEELLKANLKGPVRAETAKALLEVLSQEKMEGETDSDYEDRLMKEAETILEEALSSKRRGGSR